MSFSRSLVLFVILTVLISFPSFAQTGGDNPRFAEVGKKLDQGGSMYLYLDVKDRGRQLYETAREFILATDDSEETRKGIELAGQVLESLGVFAVEDIGFSAAKIGDLHRSKLQIRIPGERKGLFKVLGGAPHALDMLNQVPENTVMLRDFDLDVSALYDLVREVLLKVGGPEALVGIDEALQTAGDPVGANVPKVIQSLSGRWTLFLALDESAKFTIPGLEPPVTIPQPKVGIMVGTKDDTLYQTLCGIMASPEKIEKLADGTEVKMREIPAPSSDEMPISPMFAYDGKQVMVVSHADLLDYPLGRAKEKSTLADNANLKRFMGILPKEGNDVAYVSPRLWTTVKTVLDGVLPKETGEGPLDSKTITTLVEGTPITTGFAAVRVNDEGGLYVVVSSPSDLGFDSILGSGAQIGGALGAIFGRSSEQAVKESQEEAEESETGEEAEEVEEATGEETETEAPAERPLSEEVEDANSQEP